MRDLSDLFADSFFIIIVSNQDPWVVDFFVTSITHRPKPFPPSPPLPPVTPCCDKTPFLLFIIIIIIITSHSTLVRTTPCTVRVETVVGPSLALSLGQWPCSSAPHRPPCRHRRRRPTNPRGVFPLVGFAAAPLRRCAPGLRSRPRAGRACLGRNPDAR